MTLFYFKTIKMLYFIIQIEHFKTVDHIECARNIYRIVGGSYTNDKIQLNFLKRSKGFTEISHILDFNLNLYNFNFKM